MPKAAILVSATQPVAHSQFSRRLARSRVASSLNRGSRVLLSWFTWFTITTPVVGQSVSSAPPVRAPFHVPTFIGNARLRDSSFRGDAMVYSYEGGRIEALDLYTWPIPALMQLDSGRRDSLLQLEVAKFKDVLPLGQQRGLYDDYRIVFEDSHRVPLDTDTLPGYVVAFVFTRRSQPFASFFYIYALEGMFLQFLRMDGTQIQLSMCQVPSSRLLPGSAKRSDKG